MRNKATRFVAALLLLSPLAPLASAQGSNDLGTDFYLGFLPQPSSLTNPKQKPVDLYLTLASPWTVNVQVDDPFAPSQNVQVKGGQSTVVQLSEQLVTNWTTGKAMSNTVHVFSTNTQTPFSCYVSSYLDDSNNTTGDGGRVPPVAALGTHYITCTLAGLDAGKDSSGEFLIIATRDNTQVSLTPSEDLEAPTGQQFKKGTTYTITLQKGEGFVGKALATSGTGSNLTGTEIVAGAGFPIAVIQGNYEVNFAAGKRRNHVFEFAEPLRNWGALYILPSLKNGVSMSRDTTYRIVASADGTVITDTDASGSTTLPSMNKGMWQDVTVDKSTGSRVLTANKPVGVSAFSMSTQGGGYVSLWAPSPTWDWQKVNPVAPLGNDGNHLPFNKAFHLVVIMKGSELSPPSTFLFDGMPYQPKPNDIVSIPGGNYISFGIKTKSMSYHETRAASRHCTLMLGKDSHGIVYQTVSAGYSTVTSDDTACTGSVRYWGQGCAGAANQLPRLSILGCPQTGESVTFEMTNGVPGSGVLLFSLAYNGVGNGFANQFISHGSCQQIPLLKGGGLPVPFPFTLMNQVGLGSDEVGSGGYEGTSYPVPQQSSLVGMSLDVVGVGQDPGVSDGFAVSRVMTLTIG